MAEVLNTQDSREAALAAARTAGLKLPDRPRLAPWLVAVELGDGRLQLRSAESSHTLTEPLITQVFRVIEPILDGCHTVEDIVSSVDSKVLPTTVVFLLKLLQGRGLLQPGTAETELDENELAQWEKQLRFLGHFMPNPSSAQSRLTKASVGLTGSGALRQAIWSAMNAVGIGSITDLGEPSSWPADGGIELPSLDLIVACEESPAFAAFEAVNRACLASGTRWLHICMSGTTVQFGPTFVPNSTACFTCLDLRFRTHQPDLDGYLAHRARCSGGDVNRDEGSLSPLSSAVAGQAALEVMRLVTGFSPAVTFGRLYELTAVSPVAIPHDVLKVPACPSCGRRRSFSQAWDQGLPAHS